ncbi:hypothetical protein DL769_005982 [Monosporascus sp. CRB-8-3]|nr:hypothetical protein DL769_005982 [Monosporascus sp. CRB-8-3]
MKNRRERLKCLALEHLSLPEADEFGLRNKNVLDAYAARVIERLHERNVVVPAALIVKQCRILKLRDISDHGDSIYHYLSTSLDASIDAELFFDLGFRDLNTANKSGLPPFVGVNIIDVPQLLFPLWLVEHGAELFHHLEYTSQTPRGVAVRGATSAHWLFWHIGLLLYWIYTGYVDYQEPEWALAYRMSQLNAKVMPVNAPDECSCRCSADGCSPFLWMLRRFVRRPRGGPPDMAFRYAWYLQYFGSNIQVQQHMDSIRFITYEALGMQHTCSWPWPCATHYDSEEIQAIEEEQAGLLQILEGLVQDFEAKVIGILEERTTDTIAALREFWTGYWCDRIDEVLKDLNGRDISHEERIGAEVIGVRWDDESNVESEAEEEDDSDIEYWYRRIEEIA